VTRPLLVRAALRERVERTPVWFMRQAGRSLPEYRRIREKLDLFAICRRPDVCAEVTLQPVRRHGVDAAVIYSDIMLPALGMGIDVELVEGVGPVVDAPIRTRRDVERLDPLDPSESLPFALESIAVVRRELDPHRAVVGVAGGAVTVGG
jgi:uroporphyrinogen decarboxylase